MTVPILYSYRRCPYAMRARMALKYAGIAVEIREISLKDKPQSMLNVSPKATVPVLVLADGTVLEESLDIMHWALQQNDKSNWLSADSERSQALIAENDGSFKQALDKYKYAIRFPEQAAETYREQGEVFLRKLESLLSESKFLLADHISLADIAIFPFIRQFSSVDTAWFETARYPKLQIWLKGLVESELFLSIMEKQPTYIE
ncbi:MAG TPA: glutathione S-transferase [Methylotenera sp.]|nr:glutathione S-transferase [Methylotenera sp.]